jgi:hypothetical protein
MLERLYKMEDDNTMKQVNTKKSLQPYFILIGLLVAVGIGLMINRVLNPPPLPGSPLSLLGSEHRMLVLRLPAAADGQQTQIIVHEDHEFAPYPRMAWYGPVNEGDTTAADYREVYLEPEEWALLDELRTNWCFGSPIFSAPPENEPFYTAAVRCGMSNKQFVISAEELPPQLKQLIEMVSAP